jgi:hypothetical protein
MRAVADFEFFPANGFFGGGLAFDADDESVFGHGASRSTITKQRKKKKQQIAWRILAEFFPELQSSGSRHGLGKMLQEWQSGVEPPHSKNTTAGPSPPFAEGATGFGMTSS